MGHKKNKIAIEREYWGNEIISENFIIFEKLFEDHYIDVPDEKYNKLEDQNF